MTPFLWSVKEFCWKKRVESELHVAREFDAKQKEKEADSLSAFMNGHEMIQNWREARQFREPRDIAHLILRFIDRRLLFFDSHCLGGS